jgi:HSP20 family protein
MKRRLKMKRFNFGRNKKEEGSDFSLAPLKRFDIDTLFDGLFSDAFTKLPAIDVYEKDNKVIVKAELPGIEKKDIELNVDGDILTISAETKKEKEAKKKDSYYSERYFGKVQRSIRLPEGTKTEDIKASHRDGVLTIEIPRSEGAKQKGRDIEVE